MRRMLVKFPLHRLPARLRWSLLYLIGLAPVAGGDGGDDDKKFTQADVDRIVADRLARDRKDRPSDEEISELREKAANYDKVVESGQSELEREQKAREAAEKERDEAKEAAETATRTARETARRSKIVEAATKAGAINPDEVHDLLSSKDFKVVQKSDDGQEKQFEVTIGDDGQVTGVEDAVTAFLGERKHLVGESRRPDWDGGSRKPAPDEPDLAKLEDPSKVREAVAELSKR